ncbi:uncharacterized protein LOC122621656 [Drosophila teissieri]|uniref:uncharacterized protein LOC122621656 n=1 Tax=Drosophila teissieri TaxID=7243 RepID=UPI001CB9FEC1|nr:uncharacterized protein LOC122621656 [Drosophila teissieri]
MKVYLYQMRPVLFLFYGVETTVNMFVMYFQLKAFVFVNLTTMEWADALLHYFYMAYFYIYTTVTLFASLSLCTGHRTSIVKEVLRPLVGFVLYTIVSLMALRDAETDFYVWYDEKQSGELLYPEKPLHPFFGSLRDLATACLVASVISLLHCLIALDVLLSNDDSEDERKASDSSDDVVDEVDYVPVRLYVLGGVVQRWLEQFDWFQDFTQRGVTDI